MPRDLLHRTRLSRCLGLLAALGLAATLTATAAEPTAKGRLSLQPADRSPTPVVAGASDEARAAMQRFRLPEGFAISLYAAEPLLANPVALTGRCFHDRSIRVVHGRLRRTPIVGDTGGRGATKLPSPQMGATSPVEARLDGPDADV